MSSARDASSGAPDRTGATRVSVAMCTFNGEAYLREQLDSVLRQSRPVDEIIVADDASTDGTRHLLQEYEQRFPHLFRLHFHEANCGTVGNFQFALKKCSGEIIFLCDQDDVWRPDKVSVMLRRLQDPRCLLLFTDGRLIDPAGNPLGASLWDKWKFTRFRRLLWRWVAGAACRDLLKNDNKVTGATVALRRVLLDDALPIRVPRGYWHDGWLAMHAAAHDGLAFIPNRLVDYRVHPKQQVGISRNGASSSGSEIPFVEFLEGFTRRYPARAGWVERLPLGSALRARLGWRRTP